MARNIEIKCRLADWDGTLERVQSLAPHHHESLVQTDTFFECPSGRLKLREFADGSSELIFYNRSNQSDAKLSEYFRTPCIDGTAMRELLEKSNGVRGVVHKKREVFLIGQTRVHLDEVSGLGQFLELEVVLGEDETLEQGAVIAEELIVKLQIPKVDLIANAYIDLIEEQAEKMANA